MPAEGYDGPVPEGFPLPDPSPRELAVWAQAWRSPQAFAWSSERWRHYTVGMWVRWSCRAEEPDAAAALGNVVVRLADQIGMTPAGLEENGWRIAEPDDPPTRVTPADRSSPRDRFRRDEPVSALDRARERAERRDPRKALTEPWDPR